MKRLIKGGLLATLSLFMFATSINAEETFYKNENNVEMNETQYNKLSTLFSEKKMSILTEEEFEKYKDANILDVETIYEKQTYDENGNLVQSEPITESQYKAVKSDVQVNEEVDDQTRSSDTASYETSYKRLSASIVEISGQFSFSSTLDWKRVPATRSYDVFAYLTQNLSKTNFTGSQTYFTSAGSSTISYNTSSAGYKSFSNGAGVSMNLKDGTNITDYILGISSHMNKTTTNAIGRVYVSYQHAKVNLTRAQSKSYSLSLSGLGNVVYYSDSAIMNSYDGMSGVSLAVNI